VSKELLFGQVLAEIKKAPIHNPLRYAQVLFDELNEINDYAGQFHHDTNPEAEMVRIVATELKMFVQRALSVVYKG